MRAGRRRRHWVREAAGGHGSFGGISRRGVALIMLAAPRGTRFEDETFFARGLAGFGAVHGARRRIAFAPSPCPVPDLIRRSPFFALRAAGVSGRRTRAARLVLVALSASMFTVVGTGRSACPASPPGGLVVRVFDTTISPVLLRTPWLPWRSAELDWAETTRSAWARLDWWACSPRSCGGGAFGRGQRCVVAYRLPICDFGKSPTSRVPTVTPPPLRPEALGQRGRLGSRLPPPRLASSPHRKPTASWFGLLGRGITSTCTAGAASPPLLSRPRAFPPDHPANPPGALCVARLGAATKCVCLR